ncbi:MAG: hypothetical protein ACI3ZY_08535 [Parabacteroides sp.]
MKIDFVEIGKYCQEEFKKEHNSERENYRKTLFVSIQDDNRIRVSTIPHILSNASKCLLIHEYSAQAVTNWYSWYKVQFISEEGEVLDERLDEEFELCIYPVAGYNDQRLTLYADESTYYSCQAPCNKTDIQSVWNLYVRLKQASTECERNMIASLFQKDQTILELEKANRNFEYKVQLLEEERDLYKGILDDIKDLLKNE